MTLRAVLPVLLALSLSLSLTATALPAQRPAAPAAAAIPGARTFNHREEIRTGYHEASGWGSVELRPMRVSDDPELTLTALFRFRGRRPSAPPTDVSLAIASHGERPRFASAHSLVFLLDGKRRLPIGEMFRVVDTTRGETRETLALHVPTRVVLALAAARSVEGKIGATSFTLGEEQLEALRDFASRMDPATFDRVAARDQAETRTQGFVFRQQAYEPQQVDTPAALVQYARPSFPDVTPRVPKYFLFQFQVDTTGHADLSTLEIAHPEPDDGPYVEAIRRAAADWLFTPARKDGRPVRQVVRMTHRFVPNDPNGE